MTDTVKSWIEERRATHAKRHTRRDAWSEATIDWAIEFPRALDALNKVLELHRRAVDIFEPLEFCAACSTDQRTVEWPCPTVRAIEGAIND